MRYPAEHKARTRARIVGAAAELFRKRGIAATGVDAVMACAGLTPGGFYAHFASKQALVNEVVDRGGVDAYARLSAPFADRRGRAWLAGLLESYLGPAHCDDAARGCILPTLGPEMARATPVARRHFARRLDGLVALMAERTGGELELDRSRWLATVALAVGGVVLARAVPDGARAREILAACRVAARDLAGLEPRRRGGRGAKRRPPPSRPRRAQRKESAT